MFDWRHRESDIPGDAFLSFSSAYVCTSQSSVLRTDNAVIPGCCHLSDT